MQDQQRGRLRQRAIFAHNLALEFRDLVIQSAYFANARGWFFYYCAKGRLPAGQVMGEYTALAAPRLQGVAGQAMGFPQCSKLFCGSPVLGAFLARRRRVLIGHNFILEGQPG
nr:hypothetical protein [uncultured Duganella sp.]